MKGARALALVLLAGACGGTRAAAPGPAPSPETPPPALHEGPLPDYVPAAGLRWMIVAKPRELAKNAALMRAVGVVVPPVRLDLFARSAGLDLRSTPEALVAGFDYGTLYMAATPENNVAVEQLFASRVVSGAVRRSPDPRVHRISGVVGSTPEALVHVDGLLVAVATGDPTPARVVEAFARRKLKKSKPALAGAALSTLPRQMGDAPLQLYAPGPFQREWLGGAHGLLSASLAVGIAARPEADGNVEITVYLAGDWSRAGPDTTTRLLATWEDLAQGATGHLTGLDQPVAAPIVSATPEVLKLRVELASMPIAIGLKAIVAADVEEMLDTGAPAPRSANH